MGCSLGAWWRLLRRGRFRFDLSRLPLVLWITGHAACCTLLGGLQSLLCGRRIARTTLHPRPIFIIGHWRSGTTLLHQLLCLDQHHTAPTAWQCFAPHVCTLLGHWFPRIFFALVPRRRPVDARPFDWADAQEDEFALCNLGQASPYELFAFPNGRQTLAEFRATLELSPADAVKWKSAWLRFLRQVTLARPGRLVLKSPAHACRIDMLRELFPEALFVQILRDPEDVYRSTGSLWRELCAHQSVQRPGPADHDQFVIETFNYFHARLDPALATIPPSCLKVVRYEELVADPIGLLREIYDQFGLGGFEGVVPRARRFVVEQRRFRTRQHRELTSEERGLIREQWGWYQRRYCYASRA